MVQTKTSHLGKVSYAIILLGWQYGCGIFIHILGTQFCAKKKKKKRGLKNSVFYKTWMVKGGRGCKSATWARKRQTQKWWDNTIFSIEGSPLSSLFYCPIEQAHKHIQSEKWAIAANIWLIDLYRYKIGSSSSSLLTIHLH